MVYKDSAGNRYTHLPTRKNPPKQKPSKGGNRKIGRNKRKPSFLRWKTRHPRAPSGAL